MESRYKKGVESHLRIRKKWRRLDRDLKSRDTYLIVIGTFVMLLVTIVAFLGNLLPLVVFLISPSTNNSEQIHRVTGAIRHIYGETCDPLKCISLDKK